MPDPHSRRLTQLVQWYYWLTPVFLFLSWRYAFDVRVPFLDELPGARMAYYGLSFACAWVVAARPGMTSVVGRFESTLSIGVLIVTTFAAYLRVVESAARESAPLYNPFTPDAVMSLALSACIFSACHLLRANGELRPA